MTESRPASTAVRCYYCGTCIGEVEAAPVTWSERDGTPTVLMSTSQWECPRGCGITLVPGKPAEYRPEPNPPAAWSRPTPAAPGKPVERPCCYLFGAVGRHSPFCGYTKPSPTMLPPYLKEQHAAGHLGPVAEWSPPTSEAPRGGVGPHIITHLESGKRARCGGPGLCELCENKCDPGEYLNITRTPYGTEPGNPNPVEIDTTGWPPSDAVASGLIPSGPTITGKCGCHSAPAQPFSWICQLCGATHPPKDPAMLVTHTFEVGFGIPPRCAAFGCGQLREHESHFQESTDVDQAYGDAAMGRVPPATADELCATMSDIPADHVESTFTAERLATLRTNDAITIVSAGRITTHRIIGVDTAAGTVTFADVHGDGSPVMTYSGMPDAIHDYCGPSPSWDGKEPWPGDPVEEAWK